METLFEECFKGYSTENEEKTAYNKPGWMPFDNATGMTSYYNLARSHGDIKMPRKPTLHPGGDSSPFMMEEDL